MLKLGIILSSFLFLLVQCRDCPEGWLLNTKYKKCYLMQEISSDWTSAETLCQIMGGHLPSVASEKEDNFLDNLLINLGYPNYETLIGYHYDNGTWYWTDGTGSNYNYFPNGVAPYQPGMAAFWHDQEWWQAVPVERTLQFMCQQAFCHHPSRTNNISSISDAPRLKYNKVDEKFYFGGGAYYARKPYFVYASEACEKARGTLPIILNAFQNTALLNTGQDILQPANTSIFLDLNYGGKGWAWSDGTLPTYFNWAPGEPTVLSGPVRMNMLNGVWSTGDAESDVLCAIPASITTCDDK